jgi:hypothetical protein
MATDKLKKGLDEQLLEGGGGGGGMSSGMSSSVINRLYPKMPWGKVEGEYAHRNVRSAKEIEDIKARGAALPPEGSTNPQKYWTQTSSPNLSTPDTAAATIRAKVSNIKPNEAVKREHIERYNPDSGNFEPLKKGGKVTASSRGDGIASRGKTRGKLI